MLVNLELAKPLVIGSFCLSRLNNPVHKGSNLALRHLSHFLAAPIGRFEPTGTGSFHLVRQKDQTIVGSNAGISGPCQTLGHRIVLSFEIK
jgi:hypothetical protein